MGTDTFLSFVLAFKKVSVPIFTIVVFLSVNTDCFSKELIKIDQTLAQLFGKSANFEKNSVSLNEERIIRYSAKEKNVVLGYVYEDTVMGKWGPIHYLVGLNPAGDILGVVILDYQEIRGRGIAKNRFLRQYVGKNASHPLQLGKDIDGITGATISSRALTDGVKKLLDIHKIVHAEKLYL